MIDSKDVMLGNNIFHEGEIKKVNLKTIILAVEDNKKFNEVHKPIPLTPDILEKCGFMKRTWGKPDSWDQYGDSYAIGHADTNYVLHRSWEKEPDWCMGIECTDAHEEQNHISEHFCWGLKTLHQLQNLYHSLTQTNLHYI